MVLTQEEIDGCRDAFLAFDKDRSGNIDVWELRQVSAISLTRSRIWIAFPVSTPSARFEIQNGHA